MLLFKELGHASTHDLRHRLVRDPPVAVHAAIQLFTWPF
jgi:hypothetical protein